MARKTGRTKRRVAKSPRKESRSDRALKAATARFTRRATALVLAYTDAMRLTPKLKRGVAKLKADVDAWRARSGRDEIRVKPTKTKTYMGIWPEGDDEWTCSNNCALIMISRGRICLLVGCDPAYKNCSYDCIEMPTNHEVLARR